MRNCGKACGRLLRAQGRCAPSHGRGLKSPFSWLASLVLADGAGRLVAGILARTTAHPVCRSLCLTAATSTCQNLKRREAENAERAGIRGTTGRAGGAGEGTTETTTARTRPILWFSQSSFRSFPHQPGCAKLPVVPPDWRENSGRLCAHCILCISAFLVLTVNGGGRDHPPDDDQLPPTFRGARIRGTKPRAVVVFHGCSVRGFTGRVGVGLADAAGVVDASADALSRAATSLAWSFSRQQCLYLRPEPQWQGSLRPGRELVGGVI